MLIKLIFAFRVFGDAVEIAKKTGAVLICNSELAGNLVKLAGSPAKQAETDAIMGIGGEIHIADSEVTVKGRRCPKAAN